MTPTTSTLCSNCGAPMTPNALNCPACHQLAHAAELESLAGQAKLAGQAGDWLGARANWERALPLLPPDSAQYRAVKSRIENIDAQLAAASAQDHSKRGAWARWTAKLGPVGVLLWKFKTVALLVATKGKLLLLGFTKIGTLVSMFASFALYWHWYGWKFAAGFVLSIYVHEMGHVAALRRYGIAATAPMFIPGFGAIVRMKEYPHDVAEDARVGLAGPIWGLGAAVVCWLMALFTGEALWYALANAGSLINLFNLTPVWQLDGGRGFRALTRQQRGIALGVVLAMLLLTGQGMLILLALGAGYRLFSKDFPERPDNGALTQYIGLVVLLSLLMLMTATGARQ